MLIPFVVLSAAGAGEVFEPAFELIATTFGTGSSGTIDFTSIPQTYSHLQIRATVKNSTTNRQNNLRFNDISSSSYARHILYGTGSSVLSDNNTSQTEIPLPFTMSNSTTSGAFTPLVIDILDYTSTSKNTTLRALSGTRDSTTSVLLSSGFLNNTEAVTKITLFTSSGNYNAASRFSLYGIKG